MMGSFGACRAATDSPAPEEQAPLPFLLGGIQLNEEDHDRWAAALLQAGMNTVQVTVYAQQGPWNGPELWFEDDEPAVRAEIQAAHRHGLEVVLVLRVALSHDYPENRFLWHGLIWPHSDTEVTEWFERYTAFVVKWAEIASGEGVRVLGIGSEMNALAASLPIEQTPHLTDYYLDEERQRELRALVGRHGYLFGQEDLAALGASDFASVEEFLVERNRAERAWAQAYTFHGHESPIEQMNARRAQLERHWRSLIADVRDAYSGHVTFAANFDSYHEVAFWDDLDLIGINAYFPLRETPNSPRDEDSLAQGWSTVFDGIAAFSAERELALPVLFTELGYTQRSGATAAPWSQTGFVPIWDEADQSILVWSKQPIVPDERAAAVRALHSAWRQDGFPLAGILYWKLSSRSELGRYEPFMLDIGPDSEDPLLPALSDFAGEESVQGAGTRGLPELHDAVRRGDLLETRRLLDSGVDRGSRDQWGALALHWSCHQQYSEMAALLLPVSSTQWSDEAGETPIGRCARLDNVTLAAAILAVAEDRSAATPSQLVEPLRLATDQSSLEMVSLLLEAGAPPHLFGLASTTALHVAARRGHPAILGRQLESSTDAPVLDRFGYRPVDHAAYFGRSGAFYVLWSAVVRGTETSHSSSLLHHAAHGGDTGILDTLLAAGFDVNSRDSSGQTSLHFAVRKGHLPATSLLLSRGAEVDAR
ncbi:MAG: ankyrin repeat protein, partial [Bradymonadia bacterium]